jgi:hypothetical protein
MSQVKNELIESLFNAGKISFQEALILASKEEVQLEPTMYEGAVAGQSNLRELNMRTFIDSLIEPQYENENGEKVLVSFDIDKCIKSMEWFGVKWHNPTTGKEEKVTPEMLKEVLRDHIRRAINGLLEHYESEGKEEWPVSSHGFTTTAYFDDDKFETICVEIEYIPLSAANWIKTKLIS